MHKTFQAQDHVLNKLKILNSEELAELVLDSINISLGKWTLTLSSKDDLHSTANKLPKYFHRLYRCYKVSPSCKKSARKSGIYHSPPILAIWGGEVLPSGKKRLLASKKKTENATQPLVERHLEDM
jgi:hypothetical protein